MRHRLTIASWGLLGAAVIALVCGCRQTVIPPTPVVPVSGRVWLGETPLPDAKVLFVPVFFRGANGAVLPVSYAMTDAHGQFQLQTSRGLLGAVPGRHLVWITTDSAPPDDDLPPRPAFSRRDSSGSSAVGGARQLPPRYNRETQLQFVVPAAGDQDVQFRLEKD